MQTGLDRFQKPAKAKNDAFRFGLHGVIRRPHQHDQKNKRENGGDRPHRDARHSRHFESLKCGRMFHCGYKLVWSKRRRIGSLWKSGKCNMIARESRKTRTASPNSDFLCSRVPERYLSLMMGISRPTRPAATERLRVLSRLLTR